MRKGWDFVTVEMGDPVTYLYLCYILFQHHSFISAVLQGILPKGALCFWYLKQSSMEKYLCVCVCVCVSLCVWNVMCVCVCSSCIQLFGTLWTVTSQAPLSVGFSRQEYWNRLLFPSPVDLPNPDIKLKSPMSPALQADSLTAEPSGKPMKCHGKHQLFYIFTYFYFFVYTVLVCGATF